MGNEIDEKSGLRRIYRKSWPFDNLFGTLRHELNSGERGIWNDLLDMGKISRVRPGLIAAGLKTAYSHQWLAAFLNVSIEELETTLKKLGDTERIIENGSGIEILNWAKYQTEYERQKPYRRGLAPEQREVIKKQNQKRAEYLESTDSDTELRDILSKGGLNEE